MAALEEWRDRDTPIAARCITGPAGAGKTRLAIEACERAEAEGWIAGFLSAEQLSQYQTQSAFTHWQSPSDTFIVIDGAIPSLGALKQWFKELASGTRNPGDKRLRILLLERSPGPGTTLDWWADLKRSASQMFETGRFVIDAHPTPLSPIMSQRERRSLLAEAMQQASTFLGKPPVKLPRAGSNADLERRLASDTLESGPWSLIATGLVAADRGLETALALDEIELAENLHSADTGTGIFIPGYASDTIKVGEDDLDIKRDVKTLAAVMLAREVEPPLAIGLFGAWGSGKSFFMRSIEAAAEKMAQKARETKGARFCGQIVQISFNAWHYSDANLWASLVSHILDRLSAHVAPGSSPADEQAVLEAQLASTKADIEAAEADRKRATRAVGRAQKKLGDFRVERERKEVRLRDLRASEFVDLLNGDPSLKSELTAALNRVGAPAAIESANDLNRVVQESYSTAGRAAALLAGLLRGQNPVTVSVCVLLILGAPLALWLAVTQLGSERLALLSAASGEIVAFIAAATVVLQRALSHAKSGLETLSSAKQRVEEALAKKRAEPSAEETSLEHEIAQARAGEQEAGERLSAASAQAVDLEQRVAALKESQSLGYFLAERTRSEDYRRHLGLISVIRKDFETLVTRLQATAGGSSRASSESSSISTIWTDAPRTWSSTFCRRCTCC